MFGLLKGVAVLALVGTVAPAWAEAPVCCASDDHGVHSNAVARDLGKVSPATQNQSKLPDWQAFLFTRAGLRFVEVADAKGVPRAAFTTVGGSVVPMPIGEDAVHQVAIAPPTASVIYDDGSVVVGVLANSDGTITWQVYIR